MATSTSEKDSALRFADIGTLPKRMLAPIEGYEDMPLVSLEEAVKPLANIVPKIERNVYFVKQNCKNPKDGLSIDESASIMLYTFESMPHKNSLYVILNGILRSEDRQNLIPWFSYLRLILHALARLPSEHRFIFRGVKEDLRADYSKGTEFVWWGFSSCTTSLEVLENEQFFGKTGTRTLFQIDCYSGKDIKNHSFVRREDEILLLPARQFVVKGTLAAGSDIHMIQLEETEPMFPLIELGPEVPTISKPKTDHHQSASATASMGPTIPQQQTKILPTVSKSEFAEPGAYKLGCSGRACAKCHKCRDWRFTGDQATWKWIQNYKNWKNEDWNRYNGDRIYDRFNKRDGATCHPYSHYGYGHGGYGYGHGGGLLLGGLSGSCVCEDNY